MASAPAGYPGILQASTGITDASRLCPLHAPPGYRELLPTPSTGSVFEASVNAHSVISEGTVREVAVPMGWVDVKVCAVNKVWSSLRLVICNALR
jgi:hypothetical protein